jgi:hypothetical protein
MTNFCAADGRFGRVLDAAVVASASRYEFTNVKIWSPQAATAIRKTNSDCTPAVLDHACEYFPKGGRKVPGNSREGSIRERCLAVGYVKRDAADRHRQRSKLI